MSSEVRLHATRRTVTGKQVKALRRQGKLPAVVYGTHIEALPILLDAHEASLALRGVPSSHLIALDIEGGGKYTVLIREKQSHALKDVLLHIDFQALSMDEKVVTSVPVRLLGEAPVVDTHKALVMTEMESLEVEAFPADLPDYIDVDVSSISEIGDTITVGSLALGDKIAIHHEDDRVIVIAIAITPFQEPEVEEAASGEAAASAHGASDEDGEKADEE